MGIPTSENSKNNFLTIVQNCLSDPTNGPWLLILDNTDNLDLLFESGSASETTNNPLISNFLPSSANTFMIATAHDETLGRRLADRDEEIVITTLNTRDVEQLLRSKVPIWKAQNDRKSKAQLDQVLRSLRHHDMNRRMNEIAKRHTKTFAWIFDPEGQQPWDSFAEWLSGSSDKVYWIRGKAGSGKSTLMKFILDSKETMKFLNQRAPDHAIYSYFIWSSGSEVQRSLTGLLCSLVYQIFHGNRAILEDVLVKWPNLSKRENTNDWSIDSLEEVLLYSLTLQKKPVCIFIDGLDEIDPDQGSSDFKGPYYLLQFIEDMASACGNSVKICVSSRPEPAFRLHLNACPILQLQDLTRQDVDAYARDFVQTRYSFNFTDATEDRFIEEVVQKADGVFLWVSVALQSLQRGIASGDRWDELMDRLGKLPRKIEELYENMLERLGEDRHGFQKTAALYFNVFLTMTRMGDENLFDCMIAFQPELRDTILALTSPVDLKPILLEFNQRLASRCAGLLEVISDSDSQRDIDKILSRDIEIPWRSTRVAFIHSSAREFFLDTNNKLLDIDETPLSERKFRVLQARCLQEKFSTKVVYHNSTMAYMLDMDPLLSQEQEFELLGLARNICRQNNWADFYETAAGYGFQQSHALLIKDGYGNSAAVRNYLLLCCTQSATSRTESMASYLLEQRADPSWLGLVPVTFKGQILYFPTPVLGCFFHHYFEAGRKFWRENRKFLECMLQKFVKAGADLGQKFVSYDGSSADCHHRTETEKTRPIRRGGYKKDNDFTSFYLITERNCVDVILSQLGDGGYKVPSSFLKTESQFHFSKA